MATSRGAGGDLLDLERHFAFYGAYHSNPVNVAIHALFVWPIFLTLVLLVHLTAPFPYAAAVAPAIYGLYYFLLDRRAGAVAALLCFLCWSGSAALAARLGFSTGWKVVLVAQLFCWTMQFIGHGVFEKRAPALLDNLAQALLMAPFFVLLEVLHTFAGYEPYPGFHAKVSKMIAAARKEWEDKKAKKTVSTPATTSPSTTLRTANENVTPGPDSALRPRRQRKRNDRLFGAEWVNQACVP